MCRSVSEGNIRVGIGGWTYEPWRGVFYPQGLSQKRELEYASQQLSAIEIAAAKRQLLRGMGNRLDTIGDLVKRLFHTVVGRSLRLQVDQGEHV